MSDNIQWITLNNRLQQGIKFINDLNNKKYQLLLTHIITSETNEYFTDIELRKLEETLKLTPNDLQLLLQSLGYIYKQSSKVILKPTELQKQLETHLGLEQEKAEIFVKEWTLEAKKDLGNFEDRTRLDKVSWELDLQVGSDIGCQLVIPSAKIQLDLAKVNGTNLKENAILEMGEDELQQLYNTLEVIQLRLDNISKN
ncbi:unnamed protein product [Ceutorhynchus assimilis]|uniref:COMM domain-containing protein n=1 Tax=Ceutorhynchus assimilis TaxID=467358 RepID=A0A9N9MWW6_9CUCU|nr:unnamed protein product [Ceutorhynchus assimilis]